MIAKRAMASVLRQLGLPVKEPEDPSVAWFCALDRAALPSVLFEFGETSESVDTSIRVDGGTYDLGIELPWYHWYEWLGRKARACRRRRREMLTTLELSR